MDKIELIKDAIERADKMQSAHAAETYDVPALTSLKIRHLLNNIGALGKNYLEIGVHRGGTFTAAIAGNENLEFITAVDSFESDMSGETARIDFMNNVQKYKPHFSDMQLIVSDAFGVDLGELVGGIDIYLYDGGHSEDDQRQALTYYAPNMADEFIYLCDDYDWPEVQKGTQDGIRECNLEILFQRHLVSEKTREQGGHDNDSYYNGFYVALLKKH